MREVLPPPAPFSARFFARIVDTAVLNAPALPLALLPVEPPRLVVIGLSMVLFAAYFWVSQARLGASPGKRLAGVRVLDRDGYTASPARVICRELVFSALPSVAMAAAGFVTVVTLMPGADGFESLGVALLAIVVGVLASISVCILTLALMWTDPCRRALHDRIVGTRVIKDPPRPATA
ncbi:MAG: RDD family protein [Dehalococcoidia bacterium]|nr:RDD family protein [Dehalococcoidia bacterium]